MMLKWFKKRKFHKSSNAKRAKFFLTLDIGTETIKALIFSISGDLSKKITILGVGIEYFNGDNIFNDESTSNVLSGAIVGRDFEAELIKKTILGAVKKAKQNLSFSLADKELKEKAQKQKNYQVLLGLPPDVLRARIINRSVTREKQKNKIDKKEQENIYNYIIKVSKKEISHKFAQETGILENDIHWISSKILDIKIDGYQVSTFKGYDGESLEFKVLVIFLPKDYWQNIEKIITSLDFKIFKVVHLTENLFFGFKNKNSNGLFLDVGGEVTQILEVRNSKLHNIDEFKSGGRDFTKALSQTLGIDDETARIMEEDYSKKKLSGSAMKKIKEIFSWERKNWYDKLKLKLKQINPKGVFPADVFLFGGGSSTPEIEKVLEQEAVNDWQNIPISGPPKIKYISLKDLQNIEDTTKFLNKPQIMPSLFICYSSIIDN
ncbi:MAG: hypothetical protein ABH956_01040 [Candidatus Nealsonbacteria bacterium]